MPKTEKLALEIEIKKIGQGLEQVQREMKRLADSAERQTSRMKKATDKLDLGFRNIGKSILNVKTAIVGLAGAAGMGLLAQSFTETAARFEQLRISLDTLTKGKGDEWFERLNEWALKMPVNTEKAIQTFIMLRGMGLEPTIEMMTTLVDVSSALGGDEGTLEGIARALGQIYTKGKVSAEELMQLAERGVPAYEILRQKLNLTGDEVANIGKLGIDASTALNALFEGMKEKYGGASGKLMKGWKGLTESVRSFRTEFKRLVMESGPFQAMTKGLKGFVDELERAKKTGDLDRWAHETAAGVLEAFQVMSYGAQAVISTIDGIRAAFASVGKGITDISAKMLEWHRKALEFAAGPGGAAIPGFGPLAQGLKHMGILDEYLKKLDGLQRDLGETSKVFDQMGTHAAGNLINIDDLFGKIRARLDEWKAANEKAADEAGKVVQEKTRQSGKAVIEVLDEQGKVIKTITQDVLKASKEAATRIKEEHRSLLEAFGQKIEIGVDVEKAIQQIRRLREEASKQVTMNIKVTGEASPRKPISQTIADVSGMFQALQAQISEMGLNINLAGVADIQGLLSALGPLKEAYRELQRAEQTAYHYRQTWLKLGLGWKAEYELPRNYKLWLSNARSEYQWQMAAFQASLAGMAAPQAGASHTSGHASGVVVNVGPVTVNVGEGAGEARDLAIGVADRLDEEIAAKIKSDRSRIPAALEAAGYL